MTSQSDSKTLIFKIVFLCALLLSPFMALAEKPDDQAAVVAAREFLALVDGGKYQESWQKTAPHFQTLVSQTQWVDQMQNLRKQFGNVQKREVRSARQGTALPDAPVGQCFVVQFNTSFQKKESAIETVMMHQSVNGEWRAAQYFIR